VPFAAAIVGLLVSKEEAYTVAALKKEDGGNHEQ
jgi:hypothetical protein